MSPQTLSSYFKYTQVLHNFLQLAIDTVTIMLPYSTIDSNLKDIFLEEILSEVIT